MENLLNPNLDDGERLNEMKMYMISRHPTFFCPISKKILDYKHSHIIEFKKDGRRKVDIVSHEGWDLLTKEKIDSFGMKIIDDWELI